MKACDVCAERGRIIFAPHLAETALREMEVCQNCKDILANAPATAVRIVLLAEMPSDKECVRLVREIWTGKQEND